MSGHPSRRALAAGLPFLAARQSAAQPGNRPNILFVTVDDLNTDLGCYGHPIVQSPNADRLARRGVLFQRAIAQFPVCNPSRTSFLSGVMPETAGVLDNRTNPRTHLKETLFLPEFLRRNGYFTARIGKIYHDGMDGPADWDVSLNPAPATRIGRTGEGRNLTGGKLPYLEVRAAEGGDEDQPDGLIAAEAIKLLQTPREKPCFLAVGLRKPHDPYIAPRKYFEPYPLDRIAALPRTGRAGVPPIAYPRPTEDLDQETGREYRRAYYACISFMDAQLGKVLAALEKSPAAPNTLIVFAGDNGLHLGEHGWWNKVTLFQRSVAVPLIVVPPGSKPPGAVCRHPVELLSLFPTLAELCGLPPPAHLEGVSLAPLLKNPEAPWQRPAYSVVTRGGRLAGRSIRTSRYAYIEWDGGNSGVELYDHGRDPHEYQNLSEDPDYAVARQELQRLLAAARPPRRN